MNNYELVNSLLYLLYKEQMKTNINSKYRQAIDEAIKALNELKKYWLPLTEQLGTSCSQRA